MKLQDKFSSSNRAGSENLRNEFHGFGRVTERREKQSMHSLQMSEPSRLANENVRTSFTIIL